MRGYFYFRNGPETQLKWKDFLRFIERRPVRGLMVVVCVGYPELFASRAQLERYVWLDHAAGNMGFNV